MINLLTYGHNTMKMSRKEEIRQREGMAHFHNRNYYEIMLFFINDKAIIKYVRLYLGEAAR